jgi:hypothetical protein
MLKEIGAGEAAPLPKNLEKKVRAVLTRDPALSWDQAVTRIASDEHESNRYNLANRRGESMLCRN